MKTIENFSFWVTREFITDVIKAHTDMLGCDIAENTLKELEELEEEYIPNLDCSFETKLFIDDFVSDIKNYRNGEDASAFAEIYDEEN